MPTLVLIRHGQSSWNLENRFTGWWDVDLTEQGVEEARAAGRLMAEKGLDFDMTFTSLADPRDQDAQPRARGDGAAVAAGREGLAAERAALWRAHRPQQGRDRGEARRRRRSRSGAAASTCRRRRWSRAARSTCRRTARYAGIAIPATESLKDTIARVLPYWEARIAPALQGGQRVLISAHGNSLRALVKHLSNIPDDEITSLEIPTGQPIVYELDDDLNATDRYYLSER